MLASQIASLINEVYDGVERSKLGKIVEEVEISDRFPDGKKGNTIASNTFLSLIGSLCPKGTIKGEMTIGEKGVNNGT